MAYSKDEPLAFMRLGFADQNVCTSIIEEKITSMGVAFLKEAPHKRGAEGKIHIEI